MKKKFLISLFIFVLLLIVDQCIKYIFVSNWEWHSKLFSLILTYNYGVAFSMLSFLEGSLKYIQIIVLIIALVYIFLNKSIFEKYYIQISMLLAGGISNILDRFTYGGVVDYFYWHYWFDFAVFNLADVMIDIAVVFIIFKHYKTYKHE